MYALVGNQVRVAPMGGIIGLDYTAVLNVFDLYSVEDKRYMFENVLTCFRLEQEFAEVQA